MDRQQETFSIPCHNFSDIRRRPLVIGKLDQVRLPFVVTMPQLAMGAIVFGLLFLTRPVWGAIMSDRLHIVIFVAAPVLIAQQISRTSIEGRPLSKAVVGLFRLWTAPRYGTANGRRLGPTEEQTVTIQPLTTIDRPRSRSRSRRKQGRGQKQKQRRERGSRQEREPSQHSRRPRARTDQVRRSEILNGSRTGRRGRTAGRTSR